MQAVELQLAQGVQTITEMRPTGHIFKWAQKSFLRRDCNPISFALSSSPFCLTIIIIAFLELWSKCTVG